MTRKIIPRSTISKKKSKLPSSTTLVEESTGSLEVNSVSGPTSISFKI